MKDWNDDWQVKNCELAGLATFNENNAQYRAYIKGAIKLWLDRGVDALRVDTVKHMPQWFWQEFMADILTHRPMCLSSASGSTAIRTTENPPTSPITPG